MAIDRADDQRLPDQADNMGGIQGHNIGVQRLSEMFEEGKNQYQDFSAESDQDEKIHESAVDIPFGILEVSLATFTLCSIGIIAATGNSGLIAVPATLSILFTIFEVLRRWIKIIDKNLTER